MPSIVLALACRLNPSSRSRSADRVRRDAVALPGQLVGQSAGRLRRPAQRRHRIPAHVRLDQRQQRRPQPRIHLGGLLRPPPGRRTRPSGSAPASSSNTPLRTVVSLTPAACATARIPPCPSIRASAPISSRRCRSSRCGSNTANLRATDSPTCAPLDIAQTVGVPEPKTYVILSRVLSDRRKAP